MVRAVERGPLSDRDQHVVQPVPLAPVVVDVARRDDGEAHGIGEVREGPRPRVIAPDVVALELDEEPLGAEHRAAALGEPPGRDRPVALEHPRQEAVSASREHEQPTVSRFQRREVESRVAAIRASQMGLGDQAAQIGVPFRRLGEQRHVGSVAERQLRPRDRLEAELLGLVRERHRAVHAVVIGEGERRIPEFGCRQRQLLGERGAVEEGEGGMAVELDVHRGTRAV